MRAGRERARRSVTRDPAGHAENAPGIVPPPADRVEHEAGRRDPLIVCCSTQYWHEAWFRKQHFMARLSARHPVLYVEPSFSILRGIPRRCPAGRANHPWRPTLHREGPKLWTLAPPRGLPLWTHPRVSRLQYGMWGRMLRRAAERLEEGTRAKTAGPRPVWLWLYNPLYVQARGTLRPERVIFDLVDDLEAYESRAHSRATMRACVDAALREADLVFTTSSLLAEKHGAATREGCMHVVPNGVRGEWIARIPRIPEELHGRPRPWIGFLGAVFRYLDYDLLVAAARAYPGGTLVVVGPVEDPAGAARLAAEPNVALLGRCPQERVPDFVGAFDVCLSPFKAGAVRRAVNPLKVYEYLAAGRPVVSTPLESLAGEPVARWIRFAEGPDAFVRAIGEALAEEGLSPATSGRAAQTEGGAAGAQPGPGRSPLAGAQPEPIDSPRARSRRDAVRPYAWEALAERVEQVLAAAQERWDAVPAASRTAGGRS